MHDGWQATLTAMAAARGPLKNWEHAALRPVIEGLERRSEGSWFREAQLALDLHALHSRRRITSSDPSPIAASILEWGARLRRRCDEAFAVDRARLAGGGLRGPELLRWLAAHPPAERELALELLLDIAFPPAEAEALPPSPERSDYIPSGVAPLVRMVHEVPLAPDDVFLDLGSGLGKATMLVHLLSGATARGFEIQPALVALANERAAEGGMREVSHFVADAGEADLGDATVIYLYLPFTGSALASAMARVRALAEERSVVVCALGLSLSAFDWLVPRAMDDLWLTIYDSQVPGVPPRSPRSTSLDPLVEALADERPWPARVTPGE